jgi:pimeloyl-ACP methyl ester carboxylesterase
MRVDALQSHDDVSLKYAYEDEGDEKPWIVLIMPFGMKIELASAFFDFYQPRYNIVTWESRLILDPEARDVSMADLSVANHVQDLMSVLRARRITKAILVGYCSGAGIALAASNKAPDLFSSLLLVHGEYAMLDEEGCTSQFAAEIDSLLSMAAQSEKYARLVFEKINGERLSGSNRIPAGMDTPYTSPCYLHRHALNYVAYKSTDFRELAKSVSHRALLLTGQRDIQANVQSTRRMSELIQNARLHVDPESDHYGMVREDSSTMITIWNYLHEQQ